MLDALISSVVRPLKSVTHGQTSGYLPSRRASPPFDRYQFIQLGERWTQPEWFHEIMIGILRCNCREFLSIKRRFQHSLTVACVGCGGRALSSTSARSITSGPTSSSSFISTTPSRATTPRWSSTFTDSSVSTTTASFTRTNNSTHFAHSSDMGTMT